MLSKNIILALLLTFAFSISALAQAVNIVLKNSKVVVGEIVKEDPDFVLISNDIGQTKIYRSSIESITYNPFIKMNSSLEGTHSTNGSQDSVKLENHSILNDRVVVHLKNGNVVSGLLLAKSINMVMIQTEVGNLTIPKKDLQMIEYVSSAYAERGEVVVINLTNGTNLEGNIYYEDSDNLSVDTKIGRLTLKKENLRSIVYTGKFGYGETSLIDQYSDVSAERSIVQPRLDVISLGISPGFGNDYKPGYGIEFSNRFLLSESKGFYLSGIGMIGVNYFPINQDIIINSPVTAAVKGGALITSIAGGASLSVYPQQSSFFEFYVAPFLEANLIYKELDISFPSFPSSDTQVSETTFKFGAGTKIGIDFLFTNWRLGLSYDLHFVFGDEDYNRVSLNFVKEIF